MIKGSVLKSLQVRNFHQQILARMCQFTTSKRWGSKLLIVCMLLVEAARSGMKTSDRNNQIEFIHIDSGNDPILIKRGFGGEKDLSDGVLKLVEPHFDILKCPEKVFGDAIERLEEAEEWERRLHVSSYQGSGHDDFYDVKALLYNVKRQEAALIQADQDIDYIKNYHETGFLEICDAHFQNIQMLTEYATVNEETFLNAVRESEKDPDFRNLDLRRISKSITLFNRMSNTFRPDYYVIRNSWRLPELTSKKMSNIFPASLDVEKISSHAVEKSLFRWAMILRNLGSSGLGKFINIEQETAVEEVFLQAAWSEENLRFSVHEASVEDLLRNIFIRPKQLKEYDPQIIEKLYKSFLLRNIHRKTYDTAKMHWLSAISQIQLSEDDGLHLILLSQKDRLKLRGSEYETLDCLKRRKHLTSKLQNNIEELDNMLKGFKMSGIFPEDTHDFLLDIFKHEYMEIASSLSSMWERGCRLASLLKPLSPHRGLEGHNLYPNFLAHVPVDAEDFFERTFSSDELHTLRHPNVESFNASEHILEDYDVNPFLKIPYPQTIIWDLRQLIQLLGMQKLDVEEKRTGNILKFHELKKKTQIYLDHLNEPPIYTKYGDYGKYVLEQAHSKLNAEVWNSRNSEEIMLTIEENAQTYPKIKSRGEVLSRYAAMSKHPYTSETPKHQKLETDYQNIIKCITDDEAILSYLMQLEEHAPAVNKDRSGSREMENIDIASKMKAELESRTFTLVEMYILYLCLERYIPITLQGALKQHFRLETRSVYESRVLDKLNRPVWPRPPLSTDEKEFAIQVYQKRQRRTRLWIWDEVSVMKGGSFHSQTKNSLTDSEDEKLFRMYAEGLRRIVYPRPIIMEPNSEILDHFRRHKGQILKHPVCARNTVLLNQHRIRDKIALLKKRKARIEENTRDITERATGLWNWYRRMQTNNSL